MIKNNAIQQYCKLFPSELISCNNSWKNIRHNVFSDKDKKFFTKELFFFLGGGVGKSMLL
jgi:hypothetical protein